MKKRLEKLWCDYFFDECSMLDDKDRILNKKALVLHDDMLSSMNENQKEKIEKYLDCIFEMNENFGKKAFIKGCEFSASFLIESITII